MLIPLQDILRKYKITPKGVIHVGAHWAEEHDDYLKCGIDKFVYIEPCAEAFNVIIKKLNLTEGIDATDLGIMGATSWSIYVFKCACGSESKESVMYVSHQNQGQSNSFLKPSLHLIQHPEIVFDDAEIVKIVPLDLLPLEKEKFDLLVMDTEGFEGEVLKGATDVLKNINVVYAEVHRGETREGNILIEEMDRVLSDFERVETIWPSPNWTWGDAIYIRKSILNA